VVLRDNSQFGAYQVAVQDVRGDGLLSRPAVLRPAGLEATLSDSYNRRPLLMKDSGTIHGITFGATREAGEPNHAGAPGGKSVWLAWRAPASGIVTFDTMGSGFDTLLAAYLGSSLANLSPVASDDDSAGSLWSRIRFNVTGQTEYALALDGLAGADGFFVVNWSFAPYPPLSTLPLIDEHPQDRVVDTNKLGRTTFSVIAHGMPPETNLTYQWFFNGTPIDKGFGGDLPTLAVGESAQSPPLEVGEYWVEVKNQLFTVRSRPASLQFSTEPQLRFFSKLLTDPFCSAGSSDATNCCGAGVVASLTKPAKPQDLLSAASGSLTGSLTGGGSGGTRSYWLWLTNGFTCQNTVTLTATVKNSLGVAKPLTMDLYTLTGITPLKEVSGTSPKSFSYTFAAGTLYVIGIGYDNANFVVTLSYSGSACP
jgi:hypothetical protein